MSATFKLATKANKNVFETICNELTAQAYEVPPYEIAHVRVPPFIAVAADRQVHFWYDTNPYHVPGKAISVTDLICKRPVRQVLAAPAPVDVASAKVISIGASKIAVADIQAALEWVIVQAGAA